MKNLKTKFKAIRAILVNSDYLVLTRDKKTGLMGAESGGNPQNMVVFCVGMLEIVKQAGFLVQVVRMPLGAGKYSDYIKKTGER